ncbi:hypothetical protein [Winogradskyella luteola]|uniref:Uncharacterized protein n=1 Tax=Winogradskyella luteola TaxID=2828330 RepID=A0A9X1F9X9_9FLAO|nr:hypothetical protein [Winogradskyella luteola]MBV7269103.1 hypothetical protein [Winogradskyella luteola]
MFRRTQLMQKKDPYKDFVFGLDLVSNGSFNGTTDWTSIGSEWSIANNSATFSGVNNGSNSIKLGQNIPTQTFGTQFKIEFDISDIEVGKSAYFSILGNWNSSPMFNPYDTYEEGHHVLFVDGTSYPEDDYTIFGISPSVHDGGGGFTISNISVKPIIEGTALYGRELVENGDFSNGLNGWEIQSGSFDNWLINNGKAENQGLSDASLFQLVGDNKTLYKIELDAELNGGGYRILDTYSNNVFLADGHNIIFTTLLNGYMHIKPTSEVLGSTFTNISIKEVIHIPFVSENLVVNGDFSNGLSDWSTGHPGGSKGWSEMNETAVCSTAATVANRNLFQRVMSIDSFYSISFDILSNSVFIDLYYAYHKFLRNLDTGSKRHLLKANIKDLLFYAGIDNDCSIDNVSCRLVNVIPKGENVLLNGDFAHQHNWIGLVSPSIIISDGKVSFDTDDNSGIYQNVLIQGKTYNLTFEISDYSSGVFSPYTSSTGYMTDRDANGTYSETFTVNSNNEGKFWLRSKSGFKGSISNVMLKEV